MITNKAYGHQIEKFVRAWYPCIILAQSTQTNTIMVATISAIGHTSNSYVGIELSQEDLEYFGETPQEPFPMKLGMHVYAEISRIDPAWKIGANEAIPLPKMLWAIEGWNITIIPCDLNSEQTYNDLVEQVTVKLNN